MKKGPLFQTAVFALGALSMAAAWFFGIFLVVSANHVYDLSPPQSTALGALFWWALLAPPTILIGALVLALKEANGRERPKQLLWCLASPFLGAVIVTCVTWGGPWIFTVTP